MLHRILVKEERPEGQIERTILTRDGNRRLVAFQYALVRDEAGDVAGLLVSGRDVTAQKAAEETIQRLAFYDALTELPNRRLLMDRMEIALSRAARHKEKFAVMLMDLDKFKNVNDTLGHAVGDMMLKAVSARLTSAVRRMDTVARLGGDEFVILLPELENIQDCRIIAAKLLSLFNDAFYLGEKSLLISTSIGAAVYPDDGEDIETILKYADIAMYRAKEQGRNRMVMYMDGNSSLAAGAGEAPPKK
jgi:diguanylate cyclase (GGDEF)-like protein